MNFTRSSAAVLGLLLTASAGHSQVLTESFKETSASGWVFAGTNYTPTLTADQGIDTAGDGWLRLTTADGNQATSAYFDTAFDAAGATVYASFEYASWGGNGADGIAFFLFDGSTTFSVGAPGGSLGYAQRNAEAGLAGGYIGVGIDEFGNYSAATEGKTGGIAFSPDAIAVRGSEASGYAFLGSSGTLGTSIDSPGVGSRPSVINQVQVLLNATNQLTVTLQQGGTSPQTVLQMDLSSYARPETLKLGFTAGTGGQNNIHEIRNVEASTIAASLWSNGTNDSTWGDNNNWDPAVVPGTGEDILFDNTHVSTAQTIATEADRTVRSVTFDAPFDYTVEDNTLTFDNGGVAGFTGVAATQTHGVGNHAITSDLAINNDISVRNSNAGTLTLSGDLDTNGNTVTFDGVGGMVTQSGIISDSGAVIKNDAGSLTLSGANTFSGGTDINGGTLNANASTALGSGTVDLNGGTLGSTNSSTIGNTIALNGNAALNGITTSGTLTQTGGNYTLGLNDATVGGTVNLSHNNTGRTLTLDTLGSNTISGVIANGGSSAGNLTKTGSGDLILSGNNTYTGTTTISEGSITLGASDRLANASDLVLNDGTSLNLNGYSERIDNLTAGDGASIDFGTPGGANNFVFDNYTAPSSGVLVINNWEDGVDGLATKVSGQDVSSIYLSGYGVAEEKWQTTVGSYGNAYLLGLKAVTEKEWDGSSSNNWTTDANWTWWGDPNSNEVALFDDLGLGRLAVNLDQSRTLAGIKFGENATDTYRISSGSSDITLNGAVPYIQQQSDSDQELYFDDLFLGNNTVVDITGAGDLIINADIKDNGNGYALIKDGTGEGKLIINSNYSDYSGGLYINKGIVQSQYSGALGSGTAHIATGGALELANVGTTSNNIELAGDGVADGGAIHNVAGNNTLSGTLTETDDTRFTADAGTTLSLTGNLTGSGTDTTFAGAGNINVSRITTGSGGVTVESGTVTYNGGNANTYTGATTVDGGSLVLNKSSGVNAIGTGGLVVNSGGTATSQQNNQIADSAAVTLNGTGTFDLNGRTETVAQLNATGTSSTLDLGSGDLTIGAAAVVNSTINGNIVGDGSSTLNVDGLGSVYVNGNNTGFSGTTNVDAGTLNISGGDEVLGSGAVNVASGGNLQIQGGLDLDNTITINGTGSSGNGAIENFGGANTLSGSVVLGSNATIKSSTGTLGISGTVTGSGNGLTIDGSSNTLVSGVIATDAGTLTKSGTGTLTLSGANSYTGATTINAGKVIATNNTSLGTAGTGTTVGAAGTLQIQNNITIAGEALALDGTLNNASGNNTYGGAISGTGDLNVNGGTLTLSSNSSTFTGDITVTSGTTLIATADNALGAGGGTTSVLSGGTLEVTGSIDIDTEDNLYLAGVGVTSEGALLSTSGNNTVDTPMTLTANATIGATSGTLNLGTQANSPVLDLSTHDLTLNTNGGNIVVESDFTGTGDIIKTGSGTLTLNHGEAYPSILSPSTDFFLTDGTTILNTYATENSGMRGNVTIGDGTGAAGSAILQQGILESGADNSNQIIADTSNITINSDGYWDLQGHKEVVNNVTMNGGTIDAKKNVGDANRLDIGGSLSATADATINGLLGLNNQSAASIVVDSGANLDINAILSNGGFDKTGDGTLTLSGANTYVGNTEISNGIVIVDNDSGLGSVGSSHTRVDSGAQLQLSNVNIGNEPLKLSGTGHNGDGTGALRATTGTNTVSGSVALEANAEIQTDSGATLAINGNITGSGKTLTVDSLGNTTFNGNNTFNTLEKNGAGTLTVTGTNTYATANINTGTFALGNSNILADTMDVNLGAAGTFAVGGYTETIDDLNGSGTLTIASGGSLGIDKIGNAGAFTGTLDVDGIMTLNGGLIGAGADGSASTGTMMLNAASTLEIAADFVFGGTLELAANTTLKLSGAGTEFNLDTLHITGDSIIDFSGVDATTFNIGSLVIDPGVAVTAVGWDSFYDLWTAANFSGATLDERDTNTAQITFDGFTSADTIWLTYDYGSNEITVPEPSTYGAILMGTGLATFLLRRKRRQTTAPATN
ncbi:autotransporter-associated beta strand repeat-containing protein [Synoicihabitans lomoniglobus]|uniref:Autotransporter-associated beta strand repeat-containing protein n=1 Tax=Synoicihabitans lomoniglobus TaxID=2909285 RepID=A0AAE9ZS08_9BACT|nr:autotransporter-associated beta strand repeat-containing protein [Opitutaceae bacterium LMO-M01]